YVWVLRSMREFDGFLQSCFRHVFMAGHVLVNALFSRAGRCERVNRTQRRFNSRAMLQICGRSNRLGTFQCLSREPGLAKRMVSSGKMNFGLNLPGGILGLLK